MFESRLRKIKVTYLLVARFIWRQKGLWLRAVLAWLIGMAFVIAERDADYDTRLKIRGQQPTDSDVVLLLIDREEWAQWLNEEPANFNLVRDYSFLGMNDSYYWNMPAWQNLVERLLGDKPKAIGITTFFGENIPENSGATKFDSVFSDKRIIWASQVNSEGHIVSPRFARSRTRNTGISDLAADRDGIIRHLSFTQETIPHFAVQLARHLSPDGLENNYLSKHATPLINYRGEAGTFSTIGLKDFLTRNYPAHYFQNKLVIVGTAEPDGAELRTPMGVMSRAEITANLVDNIHNGRWVERPSLWLMGLLLFVVVCGSALLTAAYPQFLALFIVLWANLFYIAMSVWVFDRFYIWLPVVAVTIVSFVTYVIFLSFQLTLKEYLTVQLEKERQFLFDVEELKNNFLSLISHDLKTPIAKIQAICDRLLTQHPQKEFSGDLVLLREVATELHHYIKTILQITRVEARDFRISRDSADINEIVEAVVQQLDTLAQSKRILIELQLEPMFLAEMDQILIHEVVLNLVDNAIKYTPEGGRVIVSSREVNGQIFLTVEDTGPGIPPAEQARIFDKFYRGELGKSQPRGSGLGLYLVKYFVELHNGKVFLESTLGSGTRVGFTLPIEQATLSPQPPPNIASSAHETSEGETHEAQI
jgi:two-component system, OmpR family, phosphate regulon sensor histidine kinase PhoR